MSIERKWGTLESTMLLKKGPTKEEKEDKVTMTVTASPKPPHPKAPLKFSADPSSQNCLGGKEPKENYPTRDPKWKDSIGDHKGEDYK